MYGSDGSGGGVRRSLSARWPGTASVLIAVLFGVGLTACNGDEDGEIPGVAIPGTPPPSTSAPLDETRRPPAASVSRTTNPRPPNEIPGVSPQPTPGSSGRLVEARDALDRAISLEDAALATVPVEDVANRKALLQALPADAQEAVRALENYEWTSSDAEREYQEAVRLLDDVGQTP